MSSELLLRLFESSFFNTHLAISYLKTYGDSVGISYYLVQRLAEFPDAELEFYWPQICHMLITRPTSSMALETFILQRCEESVHIANLTMWFFQASLFDLSSTPNTSSFDICRRVLNRVHTIIFSDDDLPTATSSNTNSPALPPPPATSSSSTSIPRALHAIPQYLKLQAKPTVMGLGMMLATVASPNIVHRSGLIAIEQARPPPNSASVTAPVESESESDDDEDEEEEEEEEVNGYDNDNDNDFDDNESNGSNSVYVDQQVNPNDPDSKFHQQRITSTESEKRPSSQQKQAQTQINTTKKSNKKKRSQPSYLPGPPLSTNSPNEHGQQSRFRPYALGHGNPPPRTLTESKSASSSPKLSTTSKSNNNNSSSNNNNNNNNNVTTLSTSVTNLERSSSDYPSRHPHSSRISKMKIPLAKPHLTSSPVYSHSLSSLPDSALSSGRSRSSNTGNYNNYTASTSNNNNNNNNNPAGATSSSSSSHVWSSSQQHHSSASPLSLQPEIDLPRKSLVSLLRAHASRTQLALFTSLQDISTRLVVVPKQARLSALRAELTVLNHGLPRGCCLCIGCQGESTPIISTLDDKNNKPSPSKSSKLFTVPKTKNLKNHDRIVRISPSEAVVLNSADRAPYLIYVEILEGDLDFDPSRRQNSEDIRRALGIANDTILKRNFTPNSYTPLGYETPPLGTTSSSSQHHHHHQSHPPSRSQTPSQQHNTHQLSSSTSSQPSSSQQQQQQPQQSPSTSSPPPPTSSTSPIPQQKFPSSQSSPETNKKINDGKEKDNADDDDDDEPPTEEMDLVEQLYEDMSTHDPSFDPDAEFAPVIHNRSVDEETWNRSSPINGGGSSIDKHNNNNNNSQHFASSSKSQRPRIPGTRKFSSDLSLSSSSATAAAASSSLSQLPPSRKQTLTLDEYAERMRMAAIMLSQLNDSQHVGPASVTSSVTATVAGAGGGLVGMGLGLGAGIGGVVGAGLESVRTHLPFTSKRNGDDTAGGGQARAGVSAHLDTSTATRGRLPSLDGNSESVDPAAASGQLRRASVTSNHTHTSPVQHSPSSLASASSPTTTTTQTMSTAATTSGSGIGGGSSGGGNLGPGVRHRILAPNEAAAIRAKIMSEMMALEEERMERMGRNSGRWRAQQHQHATSGEGSDEGIVMRVVAKEDPSGAALREQWEEKKARIRKASPYGHLVNWDVVSVIVKTGADLRQEQLAVQLIKEFGRIWTESDCPHWIRYFRILVTSESTGLMETINDAPSVHSIKKNGYARNTLNNNDNKSFKTYSLYDYFVESHGDPSTSTYRRAQDNFLKSLASYSLICYLLQIKDRHNGNILVDREGHVMHIDFGFMLSNSPGSLGFEMAPFKLTQDYIDILGDRFDEFKQLLKRLFIDVRKHAERIIMLVELMQKDSTLPCFLSKDQTAVQLRERFQLSLSQTQAEEFVEKLVLSAAMSVWTRLYDAYQRASQDIL